MADGAHRKNEKLIGIALYQRFQQSRRLRHRQPLAGKLPRRPFETVCHHFPTFLVPVHPGRSQGNEHPVRCLPSGRGRFQGRIGVFQESLRCRACKGGVMAERAHQSRAGPHSHAILLRKRDTALQTRNAVAHRNGIVKGPKRIHTHIQTTLSQPAAGLVGETTAQDHYFIPDTQGHGTLPFRDGCLPFHHHNAKISFFHKISIRFLD